MTRGKPTPGCLCFVQQFVKLDSARLFSRRPLQNTLHPQQQRRPYEEPSWTFPRSTQLRMFQGATGHFASWLERG